MSDLLHQLSQTSSNPMPQAPGDNPNANEKAIAPDSNSTITTTAMAQSSFNPYTYFFAIAKGSDLTRSAVTIPTGGNAISSGSTNPYLVYLSQLSVG